MNKIWFPWQRSIRTALAVIASTILTSAAILALVTGLAPQLLEAVRDLLRPEDYLLLLSWLAGVTAVSAALSRIMAIPQIDEFLHKFGAGSSPAGAITYTPSDGEAVGLTRRQYRALIDGADTGEKEADGATNAHDARD